MASRLVCWANHVRSLVRVLRVDNILSRTPDLLDQPERLRSICSSRASRRIFVGDHSVNR